MNADNPSEQARLLREFPKEDKIFVCKNKEKNSSCYVKGRLQPTYAFGDLHLKHEFFNNPRNYDRKA